MRILNFILQVAIIAFGGIFTVTAAYFLIKSDIQNYFRFKALDAKKQDQAALLTLRLQAHERLIIFIERINPSNLLVRLHEPNISIAMLQRLAINEINTEYQHNITQQLYVSAKNWTVLRKLKDDTIGMINNVASALPADADGLSLSKKVLQHMSSIADNPYELTIELIKKDIHQLF